MVDDAQTGEPCRLNLADLERRLPELLDDDRLSALDTIREKLLTEDLRGRPKARLLTALLLARHEKSDPRVDRLTRAAWRNFQRSHDREGMALAAYVQGRIADTRGDLGSAADWWSRSLEVSGERAPLRERGLLETGVRAWGHGDLQTAHRLGDESLDLARTRGNAEGETQANALLAMLAMHEGEFDKAEEIVSATLASLVDESVSASGLLYCVQAAIAAHRGHQAAAQEHFDEALRVADRNGDTDLRGLVLAMRAELCVNRRIEDRLREAWAASGLLAGALPWWRRMAVRAVAEVSALHGDREASDEAIESLLAEDIDGVERGRALLAKAVNRLRFGDGDPLPYLEQSYGVFEGAGARYWAARVAIETSAVDVDNTALWRDRAAALSNGDIAFVRLLRTGRRLELDDVDGGRVLVDGEPVQFLTHHAELAVYLLALAGRAGMDRAELATRLWPDASPSRQRPRMRTCLWQIRRALGEEHWRLRSDGTRAFFEVDEDGFDRAAIAAVVADAQI